ncbi:MAG TPA: hypothetical protein VFG05_11780 [Methylocella sp.]|nr:hypothetical protein [Methylocella sp.]
MKAGLAFWPLMVMRRDEVINRLQKREAELRRRGVEHLYPFR